MFKILLKYHLKTPKYKGHFRITRLLRSLGPSQILCTFPEGIKLKLDPYEWVQLSMIESGWNEPATIDLMKNLISAGDVFVDIGAHIGSFGILASKLNGHSKVILIEPQPENVIQILDNISLNNFSNLEVYLAAIGAENGVVALSQQSKSDRAKLSLSPGLKKEGSYHCPLYSLNHVFELEDLQRVKLVKIDIEGYEYEALKNFNFKKHEVEHFIIEHLDFIRTSDEGRKIINLFENNGYEVLDVNGEPFMPDIQPLEQNLWCRKIRA